MLDTMEVPFRLMKLKLPNNYNVFIALSINNNGQLVFTNNTSGVAGSAIYGGWVKLCKIRPNLQSLYSADIILEKQLKSIQTLQISQVSSDQCPLNQFVFACALTQSLYAT